MKSLLILVVCVLGISMIASSYGQYMWVNENTEIPEVLLQLQIRNSEGELVSYIEANKIVAINPSLLDEFLENQTYKKIIVKDEKAFEVIQWQGKTETFDKRYVYSLFILWVTVGNEYESAIEVLHNSYQSEPGDTATVYWTVIRPAN